MSFPSTVIEPVDGRIKPPRQFSNVDLPEPEELVSVVTVPGLHWKSRPENTVKLPKFLDKSFTISTLKLLSKGRDGKPRNGRKDSQSDNGGGDGLRAGKLKSGRATRL